MGRTESCGSTKLEKPMSSQPTAMEAASQSSTGHALKDLSLNSSSFTEPVSADDAEPKYTNGVNGVNSHHVESNDFPPVAESKPLPTGAATSRDGDAIMSLDPSDVPVGAFLTGDPAVQQPVSDVREPTEPATAREVAQIQERKLEQDLARDPALVNGLGAHADAPVEANPASPTAHDDPMDISEPAETASRIENVDLPHHPPIPVVDGTVAEAPIVPATTPAPEQSKPPIREKTATPPFPQDLRPQDQIMHDVPPSPGKMARSREDEDMDDGPATKRIRADGDDGSQVPEFKVPDIPQTGASETSAVATGDATATSDGAQASVGASAESMKIDTSDPSYSVDMTPSQAKILAKGHTNTRRLREAGAFNTPVDYVLLGLPDYPDRIKSPMDLRTMEEKLKAGAYPTIAAYLSDFNQMVENSVIYNGAPHPVTQATLKLKASLEKSLGKLPPHNAVEPPPVEKKTKKAVPAVPKPKRESRASLGTAKSPTIAASPQTFALGPSGIPTIRRDSNANDGRPKREIHPPAPKDLPYSNQKPKKKKFQVELRFCQEVLNEMKKNKYQPISWPFQAPVDPVAMAIPSYYQIIKKPMDISTVDGKLRQGAYENAKEFEADIRLMFTNCYKFNPRGDEIHRLGKQYEEAFDEKWANKKAWIEEHTPASGPQTPGTSPEPDEDDDEDEEEEEEDVEDDQISILQKQIAAMSKQVELITQKKKTSPPAAGRKNSKGTKPTKKETKKAGGMASKGGKKENAKPLKKTAKAPYVTYEQKQDISNRINTLPEARMATALSIIRDNMPNLKGVQEDEIELDIDELSNEVLYKLLGFVRKYAPVDADFEEPRPAAPSAPVPSSRPKKNKPMSKTEQEAKIQEIKGKLSGYNNATSDTSPEPSAQAQAAEDTSGDEDDSEESEED